MREDLVWWTSKRVEELKTRWANNETGTTISTAMRAKSRAAILGKVNRLGLAKRKRPEMQDQPS